MDYFPLFFQLKDRHCLIIGGGSVAARKLRLLLKTPAEIVVLAPELHPETRSLISEHKQVRWVDGRYDESYLEGQALVIVATEDSNLNRSVAGHCGLRNLPVNVVDQPELCTVITPAIVDRSPIVVAISSSASAPVLARQIRNQIESLLPSGLGEFSNLLGRYRAKISSAITEPKLRLRFWQSLIDGRVKQSALSGRLGEAESLLNKAITEAKTVPSKGEVYLVGAGPGDPELLTLKALRLMQQADVVLYDRLVSDEIMDMVRRDADRLYVGKRRDEHSVPQEDINQLLVTLAKEGKRVLRLKGGDPFIFGRGGEELETLAEQGVEFQVVPGITAASGCASYAGIPLTHRDHAQSVRFITGHLKNQKTNIRWAELAAPDQTLVFYMSLIGLPTICEALIKAGRDASTPAALVEKGTTSSQRVLVSDLQQLPELVATQNFRAPTLLIIGNVVQLRDQLNWFGE